MTSHWYDWAGYIGVALVLLAYLLLQARRLNGHGLIHQSMNILGALGVMLSLLFGQLKWPAFVMELAWLLIGIYGLVHGHRVRRKARRASRQVSPP